jgi:hypothetical protein
VSVNFLDTSGFFAGMDMHPFYFIPPPPPLPPAPPVPNLYAVGGLHGLPTCRFWRVVGSVTTGAFSVLQSGFAVLLVPHISVPPPVPHPILQPANLAVIIITSSSAPAMSVSSVTAKGQALLTASAGSVGANTDCGMLIAPSAVDLNFNSVKTTPTLGDYVAASVSAALNGVYGYVTGGIKGVSNPASMLIALALNMVDMLGTWVSPWFYCIDFINWLIGQFASLVQSTVDQITNLVQTAVD